MYQRVTLAAGVAVDFQEASDFFRMLEGAQADASVIFYYQGREVSRAENIGEGYSERFTTGAFDKWRIQSTAGGVFEFVTRLGNEVGYDKAPTGDITLGQGAFAQGRASVTNANQVIIAANASRRFLMIQNNDASAFMRVTLSGAAATAAQGFRLAAGDSLDLSGYQCTAAINVMMETATAAADNVEWAEG